MKYFSEKLNKVFDTERECMEAEFKVKVQENTEKIKKERELALAKEKKEKEVAERKACAEKVEAARKAYLEAQKAYRAELDKFIKTYGSFHMSWSANDMKSIEDLLDTFGMLFI